jgi:hypothetical protein
MSAPTQTASTPTAMRWAVIIAIAGVAFFGSYSYAVAHSAAGATSTTSAYAATTGAVASGPSGAVASTGGGGGCCGGGSKGPAVTMSATVANGVQTIAVDLSSGSYDPNTIQLKAGVPAEITFGQSSGCTGQVQSQQLGFAVDLTSGPQTVKLAGFQPGTYQFSCGMGMVTGTIVVQ